MNWAKSQHPKPQTSVSCKSDREALSHAVKELARFRTHGSMPHDFFIAELQRIADEHSAPCGCDLIVQHTADGVIKVQVRSKVHPTVNPCEVCETIECFLHKRPEI